MKIAFFDTKPYDKIWFEPLSKEYGHEITFFEEKLNENTAVLANGFSVAIRTFIPFTNEVKWRALSSFFSNVYGTIVAIVTSIYATAQTPAYKPPEPQQTPLEERCSKMHGNHPQGGDP